MSLIEPTLAGLGLFMIKMTYHNQNLEDIHVLCMFKIDLEYKDFDEESIKLKIHEHIMMKSSGPSRVLHSPKVTKVRKVLSTIIINSESKNSYQASVRDQEPHSNHEQNTKPQSGALSIFRNPNQDSMDMDVL